MHSASVRASVRAPLRLLLDAADDAQHAQPVQDGPASRSDHRQPHRQEFRQVRPKISTLRRIFPVSALGDLVAGKGVKCFFGTQEKRIV